MKEVPGIDADLAPETASFLGCVATILELPLAELPRPAAGESPATAWGMTRWLGGRGLGLVAIADPASFVWAGPWIAGITVAGGRAKGSVVMYGVPSGVVWDPMALTGGEDWRIEDGFVLSALDVALAPRPERQVPAPEGVVEEILIASSAGSPTERLQSVSALAGRGLQGDRHVSGSGTFPSGVFGSALTLIEAEVCESFDPPLRPDEHRRNLITRGIGLNELVGREFTVGGVRCRGARLCEPCRVVDGYASRPVLRALVHRGGLRAEILEDGRISVGDRLGGAYR